MTRCLPQLALAAALALLFANGCRKAEIRVYDASKSELNAQLAVKQAAVSSAFQATWSTPEDWKSLPPTPLNRANFVFEDPSGEVVRIAVSTLHLATGLALYELTNEIRAEAGLPPLADGRIERHVVSTRKDSILTRRLDILISAAEDAPARLVATSITSDAGPIWRFSIYGPETAVEGQLANFEAFLGSVVFADNKSAAEAAQSHSRRARLLYEAPEDWVKIEGSGHREAGFEIRRESFAPARLTISSFLGDAGGLPANINRWRRQISLEEWPAEAVQSRASYFNSNGLQFLLFDLKADSDEEMQRASERILAAVLESNGRVWFLKLRGDRFLLETQRNNFRQFLRTIRVAPAAAPTTEKKAPAR